MKVASITRTSAPTASWHEARAHGANPRVDRTFLEILREGRPPSAPAAAAPPAAAPAPSSAGREVARLVERSVQCMGANETRLDALLEAAARGKTFTPAELIAMQAVVFRYSQTVEMLSRGADKLVGAVKQTLGTQI